VPSLPEQRRIVARVEVLLAEVSEARKLHRRIVADTGRVMEACIAEAFDREDDSWAVAPLAAQAFIQTGTAKGRRFGTRQTVSVPYLRVANVQAGFLDLGEIKEIRIAEGEVERYRLRKGDLLLTEGGDYDKLGRGAIWRGELDLCVHQNHIFAVRFDPSRVLPEFAEYEMQSNYAKTYFLGVAKKTTNLATINKTQLGAFPLKYLNMAEQHRIVARLGEVQSQMQAMRELQARDGALLEHLEQSILAQAFRGEL
jgi:type I restriction enzyme S subunit